MSLSYYVIHLVNRSPERMENIQENEKILKKPIQVFPAIDGRITNTSSFDSRIVKKYNANPGEIGCYLSHMNLMKHIQNREGYSVVFEDDLEIMIPDLDEQLQKIIENMNGEFDMIYLGTLMSPMCVERQYKGNVHHISKSGMLYGTHAYLVNNKSAQKIYENLYLFSDAIDNKYKQLYDQNILKNYIVYPYFVSQKSKTTMKSIVH